MTNVGIVPGCPKIVSSDPAATPLRIQPSYLLNLKVKQCAEKTPNGPPTPQHPPFVVVSLRLASLGNTEHWVCLSNLRTPRLLPLRDHPLKGKGTPQCKASTSRQSNGNRSFNIYGNNNPPAKTAAFSGYGQPMTLKRWYLP